MSSYMTQEKFLSKCMTKHEGKYDYSLVRYEGDKSVITLICPTHGKFNQVAGTHSGGAGCKKCGADKVRAASLQKRYEGFLLESNIKHTSKYGYGDVDYINSHTAVNITCKYHGNFLQTPASHKRGSGCPSCAKASSRLSQEQFLQKASKVHNKRYDYSKSVYEHSDSKILVTCELHGDFSQKASMHLFGYGCQACAKGGGNNLTIANRRKGDYLTIPSGLYVMQLDWLSGPTVYKVGITRDLRNRVRSIEAEATCKVSVLYYTPSNLYDSILKENEVHLLLQGYGFVPDIKFSGYTECFSLPDETATDLIEYLNETFGEDKHEH